MYSKHYTGRHVPFSSRRIRLFHCIFIFTRGRFRVIRIAFLRECQSARNKFQFVAFLLPSSEIQYIRISDVPVIRRTVGPNNCIFSSASSSFFHLPFSNINACNFCLGHRWNLREYEIGDQLHPCCINFLILLR